MTTLQSIIVSASKHQHPTKTPMVNLLSYKLLRVYPSTVIVKPANSQLPYSTHATTATATAISADSTAANCQEYNLTSPRIGKAIYTSPHAAFVVLSSCDSGHGTIKADGIQGMAHLCSPQSSVEYWSSICTL